MRGPFYRKNEDQKLVLLDCCRDCAFAEYGMKNIDATCIMLECPCMPPDESEDLDNE